MNVIGKLKAVFGVEDYEEYENDVDIQEEPEEEQDILESDSTRAAVRVRKPGTEYNRNVVNINATSQLRVVLLRPESYSRDANDIADHLKAHRAVLMNLERTPGGEARRLLDFLSGVAYAQEGSVQRVAEKAYLISPCNVEVDSADFMYDVESLA